MALNRAGNSDLGRLVKLLESIGDNSYRARLSQRMSRTMLRLVQNSIDTSTDCYGRQMLPRVDDGAAPLKGLRNSFMASFTVNGPRVGTDKWYAKVHNRGWRIEPQSAPYLKFRLPSGRWVSARTVIIPRRQLVPTFQTGLGPVWGPVLRDDADAIMREYLRGR